MNALKHGHRSALTQKFKKLLRLQSQFLKKFKAHERVARMKRRMVLEMLKNGITRENFSEIYERTGSVGDYSRNPDKTSDYVNNIYAQSAKIY